MSIEVIVNSGTVSEVIVGVPGPAGSQGPEGAPGPMGPQGSAGEIINLAPSVSSFASVKTKIAQGSADVAILFIGDSTGNESGEWIYLFAHWLGSQFPTHTVTYRLYDSGTDDYGPASILSNGTGTRTISVWNNSFAGGRISDRMGSRYATSITAMNPDPDLIWINDGINRSGEQSAPLSRAVLLEAMQQILLDYPDVPFALTLQNPFRDNTDMDAVIDGLRGAAEHYPGMAVVDFHSRFLEAGKPAAWYSDNIHPNALGQAAMLAEAQRHWSAARDLPARSSFEPWMDEARGYFNLIDNGDFAAWTNVDSPPDGFSENSTNVVSQESTIVFPGKPYSVEISGSGSQYMQWQASISELDAMRGKQVTLAVRKFVPAGSNDATGRTLLRWDGFNSGESIDATSINSNYSQGGWFWQFITGNIIPRDATFFQARFYQFDNDSFYVDEVVLYEGNGRPAIRS